VLATVAFAKTLATAKRSGNLDPHEYPKIASCMMQSFGSHARFYFSPLRAFQDLKKLWMAASPFDRGMVRSCTDKPLALRLLMLRI
jgi:hypothetical protein